MALDDKDHMGRASGLKKAEQTMVGKPKAKGKSAPKPEKASAKGKSKGARAGQPPEGAAGADVDDEADGDRPKRKLGLRGAAPWAARHAAKHAAEARARAAEPPPPGSARATIRTPSGVEEIKAQIVELHNTLEQIKSLRKNIAKSFFDVGTLLRTIHDRKLYGAKGFQSFESFLEREVDLSKSIALRLVRLVAVFQREAALEYGMERTLEVLGHLETGSETQPAAVAAVRPPTPSGSINRPPIVGR